MRLLKCYGTCGEKYEKSNLIIDGGKNYCEKCYNEKIKDIEDRKILYSKICSAYKVKFPTGMHLSQIKNLKRKNYTYEDMYKALDYCIINLKMTFNPTMGFGWVENKIEESMMHNRDRELNVKKYENISFEESKVIKVTAKIDNSNRFKESKLIKLEEI